MRGKTERIDYEDKEVLLMKKSYGEETVTIVINFSKEEKSVLTQGKLKAQLCVSGSIEQNGTTLTMPGYSIAILK